MFSASSNLAGILSASRRNANGHDAREIRNSLGHRLKNSLSRWEVVHINSSFTRRITTLRWHPWHPQKVAFGTHSGDIVLWEYTKPPGECPKIEGLGYGDGCITEMRFHPHNLDLMYATSVDGKFHLKDFTGRHSEVLLDTKTLDYWWCSVDYSVEHGVLLVGDNRGEAVLMDFASHKTLRRYGKLHKSKIKHIEFCPARSWMLVTTSVDRTMKLWDIRMLRNESGKPEPLSTLVQNGLISTAYFDPIHGVRLLTTSQNGEIRVYDSHNLWKEPSCIVTHPHRSFQHMTDIRATWHPLYEDMCVIGRWPKKDDPSQLRTVDLIDLKSKEVCGQLHCPHLSGIIQLNEFSRSGDCLASGMGYTGLIWKLPEKIDKASSKEPTSGLNGILGGKELLDRKRGARSQDKDKKSARMKLAKLRVSTRQKQ